MTDETTGAAINGGPAGLTNAEKLTAVQTYLKALAPIEEALRHTVNIEMGTVHAERVGAYLPDGTKLGAVSRSEGRKSAKVRDEAAALAWCVQNYPDEVRVVRVINPVFLKTLLDVSKTQPVGGPGVDPRTGEELPFIEVSQGSPYVSVTTTEEGVERMTALAYGFPKMLERAHPGPRAAR